MGAHGHGCAADHYRGEYTERKRADLDMVLAFNHRLVAAIDDNLDVTDTVTHSFGEPCGAQRGGVEVSVCGPADAPVIVDCAGRSVRIGLAQLAERLARGPLVPDDEPLSDTAFYYARAFQVDGELAWSSPLWVRPKG